MKLTLTLFLGLFSLWGPFAQAEPEREIKKLLEDKSVDSEVRAQRILAIVMANPTEPVLLEAAKYPSGSYHSSVIRILIRPWVSRSPKLRDYFYSLLKSSSEGDRNKAIAMLSEVVERDPAIHEQMRVLASKNVENAIFALARFYGTDLKDQKIILAALQNKNLDKHNRSYLLRRLGPFFQTHPEIKKIYLDGLKNEKDPQILLENIKSVGRNIGDPDLFAELRKIAKLPNNPNSFQLKSHVLWIILRQYPEDSQALEELPKLLREALHSFDKVTFQNSEILTNAMQYLDRSPALNKAISEELDHVILNLDHSEAYLITRFLELYIAHLNETKSWESSKIEKLIRAVPEKFKDNVLAEVVVQAKKIPEKFHFLVEEAIKKTNSIEVGSKIDDGQPISKEVMKVVFQDLLHSIDETRVTHAIEILKRAVPYDPSALPLIKGFSHNIPKLRTIAVKALKEIDPSLAEAQLSGEIAKTNIVTEKVEKQRSLLFDMSPPQGWKQVVKAHMSLIEKDPFLFMEEINLPTRQSVEQGFKIRENALMKAKASVEAEGYVSAPVNWVLGEYEKRKNNIVKYYYTSRLTPSEQKKIEMQAAMRVRSEFPQMTAEEMSQSPYKEQYQRYVRELEFNFRRKSQDPKPLLKEMVSEEWRENTQKELQEKFRSSLKSILNQRLGKIIALDPDSRDVLSKKNNFEIREQDLPEIKIIPYSSNPPYTARIEWRGKAYYLYFLADSLKDIEVFELDRYNTASEIAALTLGSHNSNLENIAKETYIARSFANMVFQFQRAYSDLHRESALKMGDILKEDSEIEKNRNRNDILTKNSERALTSLLWLPIEKNPNHWRQREAEALLAGRTGWSIRAPEKQKSEKPKKEEASKPPPPRKSTSLGMAEDTKPHNKPIHDEMRENILFKIEQKTRHDIPVTFLRDNRKDFTNPNILKELGEIPFEDKNSQFILHAEAKHIASPEGFVSILKPYDAKKDYKINSLQVFSVDGTRLYAGSDYDVVTNSETGGFAVKIKNPRVNSVLYSAGYLKGESKENEPPLTLGAEKIEQVLPKLKEIGFSVLSKNIEELLKQRKAWARISISDLAAAFRKSGVYATSYEKDLGLQADKVSEQNPFKDYAKFVNSSGKICIQCDGAAEFFTDFLKHTLDSESGLKVTTQATFERQKGELVLTEYGSHLITRLNLLGRKYFVDTTPPIEKPEKKSISTYDKLRNMFRPKMVEKKKIKELPKWLEEVKDQVPEATETHATQSDQDYRSQENTSSLREDLEKLKTAQARLIEAIKEGQKNGLIPQAASWDKTEPLSRSIALSNMAIELLNDKNSHEEVRESLRVIANLSNKERLLFQKYLKSQAFVKFPHYKQTLLQDRIQFIFRHLEDLETRYCVRALTDLVK
jgi:hypothetical protein